MTIEQKLQQFKTASGARYYALLKDILNEQGAAIQAEFANMSNIRLIDVGRVFLKYGWPENRFKPFVEYLEAMHILPTGTHDEFRQKGMKVGVMLAYVRSALEASE